MSMISPRAFFTRQTPWPSPCVALTRKAFSLVEVTIAIGVVSFSLLAIMGLVPVGLTTLRAAMDQTVESQIVQAIGSEALLTPFGQLTNSFAGKVSYYNEEGTLTGDRNLARYEVATSLTNAVYPGSTNAAQLSSGLQSLRVKIVRLQGVTATNNFSIQVSNSGN